MEKDFAIFSRPLKNYLHCRCGVKKQAKNAHLLSINCAFSPIFALHRLPQKRFSTAC